MSLRILAAQVAIALLAFAAQPATISGCHSDRDHDGHCDRWDNCPDVFNFLQEDIDGNGVGDACEPDLDGDGDGVQDSLDNCPSRYNRWQIDSYARDEVLDLRPDWSALYILFVDTAFADLDGDGDTDLLTARSCCGLAWYENDGRGGFDMRHDIGQGIPPAALGDVNRDGRLDIVARQGYGSRLLIWHEALGGGLFTEPRPAVEPPGQPDEVVAADLDDDGDADLLVVHGAGDLTLFENRGRGFASGRALATGTYDEARVADLDGDGDLDLAAYATVGLGPYQAPDWRSSWFENLGNGSFSTARLLAYGGGALATESGWRPRVIVGGESLRFYRWIEGGDGVGRACDNCPYVVNPDQSDVDGDGLGDACERSRP